MTETSRREANKKDMRARILAAAGELFYSQGIRAVGVDTVAAAADISKRTLYNYFPSKDELILAYLELHFRRRKTTDAPPLEQIMDAFDRLEGIVERPGFRGCPFVNAVTELGAHDHPAHHIARKFKDGNRQWFRDRLDEAGAKNADVLAAQLAILVDGALVTALVAGEPEMARVAKSAAETLIAGALPDGREIP